MKDCMLTKPNYSWTNTLKSLPLHLNTFAASFNRFWFVSSNKDAQYSWTNTLKSLPLHLKMKLQTFQSICSTVIWLRGHAVLHQLLKALIHCCVSWACGHHWKFSNILPFLCFELVSSAIGLIYFGQNLQKVQFVVDILCGIMLIPKWCNPWGKK